MTTLRSLHDAMWAYNQTASYGSECNAWGDFVADSHDRLGCAPWDEHFDETCRELPGDFVTYWRAVADGESADYDAATGDRSDPS